LGLHFGAEVLKDDFLFQHPVFAVVAKPTHAAALKPADGVGRELAHVRKLADQGAKRVQELAAGRAAARKKLTRGGEAHPRALIGGGAHAGEVQAVSEEWVHEE
jgi:hypothetical protein